MNLREAAELAMYALESTGTDPNDPGQAIQYKREEKAIARLRQAIAESEKKEPWVKTYCGGKPNYTTPEQEPVAWREVAGKTTHYYDYNEDGRGEPLYAAPQPDLARVGEVGVWEEEKNT
jgi:hypothetical protein